MSLSRRDSNQCPTRAGIRPVEAGIFRYDTSSKVPGRGRLFDCCVPEPTNRSMVRRLSD